MVLDTSAIMAILLHEPERDDLLRRLRADPKRLISTVALVELEIVLTRLQGPSAIPKALALLRLFSVTPVSFTVEQSTLARQAFQRYGKGRHPAALNFGDCITYALAKHTAEPLLAKGHDFPQTDLPLA